MKLINREANLFTTLILLSLLFIFAQCSFFSVHYSVSSLLDSLAESPLAHSLLHPVIIVPVLAFIFWQLFVYFLLIWWAWFSAHEWGELLQLPKPKVYFAGIILWLLVGILILTLNHFYYPESFFAKFINQSQLLANANDWLAVLSAFICFFASLLAFVNVFFCERGIKNRVGF